MIPIESDIYCLVFRTNLETPEDVDNISETLDGIDGVIDWSVDLEDWEKVLRIEGIDLDPSTIRKALFEKGVIIREMPID